MNRFHFSLGLMTLIWLLSACQPPQSNPRQAALSSSPVFCDGGMAWSAEVTTDDVMDYTTFWVAFDPAIAHERFPSIHVDVTLNGESFSHEMKYRQAAESYSVTCTDSGQQFEASRVKYTLLLPRLSSEEENTIFWKYTLTADLNEEVFNAPSGVTAEYTIKLNLSTQGG